jgi:hypothetical protein
MLLLTIISCLVTLCYSYFLLKKNELLYDLLRSEDNSTLENASRFSGQEYPLNPYQNSVEYKVASLDDARSKKLNQA